VELHWGFPGQLFFVIAFLFVILGILYFVNNRRA
jgi:hypothetical protein